jgi:type I restriction-modification system DNA methylase subunit
MVVPHGVLFGPGICARIKEELLREFNLHTIVRLPNSLTRLNLRNDSGHPPHDRRIWP